MQLKAQFGSVLGQSWLDWHDNAKKAVIVAGPEERFSKADLPADDPRKTWLPNGF